MKFNFSNLDTENKKEQRCFKRKTVYFIVFVYLPVDALSELKPSKYQRQLSLDIKSQRE